MRRGAAAMDLPPQPVPQYERGTPVANVQVLNGFWQFLPSKSTTFIDRVYFKNFPRPITKVGFPSHPFSIPLATLEVPLNQAFILKSFSFRVFQQSGVGVEDIVETPPSRVASYLGFEILVGNQSPFDFNTNVTARGQVINYNPAQGPGKVASPPVVGQGSVFPFSGPVEPLGEAFATYAQSGQNIIARVWVLREPEFEARMLSVRISGYNLNSSLLQTILSRISTVPFPPR